MCGRGREMGEDFRQWEYSEKDKLVGLEPKYCNSVEIKKKSSRLFPLLVYSQLPSRLVV